MLHYGISTNSCVVSASHAVLCVMMIVDLHGLLLYVHDGQVHHFTVLHFMTFWFLFWSSS